MRDSERYCVWRFQLAGRRVETRRQHFTRMLRLGAIAELPADLATPGFSAAALGAARGDWDAGLRLSSSYDGGPLVLRPYFDSSDRG